VLYDDAEPGLNTIAGGWHSTGWKLPKDATGPPKGLRSVPQMRGRHMKEADVNEFRTLLMAKREEIVGQSCRREDIWIVQSNEQIEMVQMAGQREFAARALERETRSLVQIDAALKRIVDGEFGICLDCEEVIAPKRLAAVPWAAYCLHCQESHDAQEATNTVAPRLAA